MMPDAEQRTRLSELTHHMMLAMTSMMESRDWFAAVRLLSDLGREADVFIADYYDQMTAEELTTEIVEGEPTPRAPAARAPRIGYSCLLTREELAQVKHWDSENYTGHVLRDAALAFIREAEGVRVALAKVSGREPTRAEVLTGLMLRTDEGASDE